MALTPKQQRFADEYLIDLNGTQAAIRAGYAPRSAEVQGSRLLSNDKVRAYIDKRMAEISKRTGVNQERIIRELARIAFVNAPDVVNFDDATIREDATADDTAAIASIKVKTIPTQDGQGVEREIRFVDKKGALELLGKRYGMWLDRQKIEGAVPVQIIDDVPKGSDSS